MKCAILVLFTWLSAASGAQYNSDRSVSLNIALPKQADFLQRSDHDDDDDDEDKKMTLEEAEKHLPPGWEASWSEDEQRYYYANRETGESTWKKPVWMVPHEGDEDGDGKKPTGKVFKKDEWVKKTHYKTHVKKIQSHEHHIFAKGIIVTVVVLCTTVCLASTANSMTVVNTWLTIDAVVTTFLAISWYYIVMHFLDIGGFRGLEKLGVHLAIGCLLLLASSLITWFMQQQAKDDGSAKERESVSIFKAVFTPMIMWCHAGAVSTAQKLVKSGGPIWVFWVTVLMLGFYALLAVFWYFVVGGITKRGWSDDTVNGLAGSALAAGFLLFVHMLIVGSYQTVEDPHPTAPGMNKTLFLNAFGLLYVVIACLITPKFNKLSQKDSTSYLMKRIWGTLAVFINWLPYFSCICSLGHLIVDNLGYNTGAIEARLLMAVVTTIIGMGMIVLCARTPLKDNADITGILVGLGGFMVGGAWSGLLDNSINMMVKGDQHPFWIKFQITSLLTAFIFPTYFYYLKPLIQEKTNPPAVTRH